MDSITVPEDLNQGHLGFALDAGGSVVKIVYRPKDMKTKEDGKTVLCTAFIDYTEIDSLIDFLQDKCDITIPEGETPEAFFTGVRIQGVEEQLMKTFGVKVIIYPEYDASAKAVSYLTKQMPPADLYHPIKQETMANVLKKAEQIYNIYYKENTNLHLNPTKQALPIKLFSQMTQEEIAGATMMANMAEITWPIFVVMGGSAMASYVLKENGEYAFGDFSAGCGRMLLGLGQLILGTNDFDEIMDLASRGNSSNVHVRAGDMKYKDSSKRADMYAEIPDFITLFSFGKVHDKKYEGTYSREDLAAALVHHIVMDLAQIIELNLTSRNINTAVITGSLFEHELVRNMFYEEWLMRVISPELQGKLRVKVMQHSGHIPAVGCWMHYFDNKTKP